MFWLLNRRKSKSFVEENDKSEFIGITNGGAERAERFVLSRLKEVLYFKAINPNPKDSICTKFFFGKDAKELLTREQRTLEALVRARASLTDNERILIDEHTLLPYNFSESRAHILKELILI